MLRTVIVFFIFFLSNGAHAQSKVEWHFAYDSSTHMFIADAKIEEGWHLYSQFVDENAGPVPTSFVFTDTEGIQVVGKTIEPNPIAEYDENFESDVLFFKNHVQFKQKIKAKKKTQLQGSVTFMVCDDTMCLPPVDQNFSISIHP